MANSLGNYNETFFAQEALIQLEKQLGMAGRVYRGYDPNPKAHGDTINIRRPSTFTAQAAPSVAQDLATESVSIQLNQWKEVKIKLTDKELSLSADKLIEDHIRPAAVALADDIDQALNALYTQIPWYTQHTNPFVMDDLTAVRKIMQDNKVPMRGGNLSLECSTDVEAFILNKLAASGMQPNQQDAAIRAGTIGSVFGFDAFANQNTPQHTSGVAADAVGALTVATAVGGGTITFNAVTAAATFKKGDPITITGDSQQYTCAADTVADGAGLVTAMPIYPLAKKINNIGAVVTVKLLGAAKNQSLAFHRNAFALAMAPLTELGNELGAKITTVSDPISNLTLRSRMFYVGDASAVYVALDVLYGVVLLDPNLAVRMSQP